MGRRNAAKRLVSSRPAGVGIHSIVWICNRPSASNATTPSGRPTAAVNGGSPVKDADGFPTVRSQSLSIQS